MAKNQDTRSLYDRVRETMRRADSERRRIYARNEKARIRFSISKNAPDMAKGMFRYLQTLIVEASHNGSIQADLTLPNTRVARKAVALLEERFKQDSPKWHFEQRTGYYEGIFVSSEDEHIFITIGWSI